MKRTIKFLFIMAAVILPFLDCSAAKPTGTNTDLSGTVTSTSNNYVFTYKKPTSGTFTCDVSATGPLATLTALEGTFTCEVIDNYTVVVTTTAKGTTSDKIKVEITNVSTVDLMTGTLVSTVQTVTAKLKNDSYTAVDTVSSGYFTGREYNTLVILSEGTLVKD